MQQQSGMTTYHGSTSNQFCSLASVFESAQTCKQDLWLDSCSGHFSGGGCPAAGLPFNTDSSQQVAE